MEPMMRRYRWEKAGGPGGGIVLDRRGVRHGTIRPGGRATEAGDARELWAAARPLWFPRALALASPEARGQIRRSRQLFRRAEQGRIDFQREIWRRLDGQPEWAPAGAAVDLADDREIEKVFVDRRRGGRIVQSDLWAKLSWISRNERDPSLRIRFSFGSEQHDDWQADRSRAVAADRLAEAVFPEGELVAGHPGLGQVLRRVHGRAVRLSERIVFANAPGGGAAFHHDAETEQLGVLYAQIAGKTAWLALPKRDLASVVAEAARGDLAKVAGSPARALRALERHDLPALDRLLNSTPSFTRRLVERGALSILSAGDILLLPSPGPDDAAWHSVFALGNRPSLAHSYGIFAAR
jgi:hypothetical protein